MQLSFRLGNENFTIGVFELNVAFHFSKGEKAQIKYDRNKFWRNTMGKRGMFYRVRTCLAHAYRDLNSTTYMEIRTLENLYIHFSYTK